MSKVAVLGGGLSGRLMAFQLAEQGISVELFEKGERNGAQAAAYVAAAMLAPSAEAVEATPRSHPFGQTKHCTLARDCLPSEYAGDDAGKRQPDCLAHAGQAAFRRVCPSFEARRRGGT